MRTVKWSKEAKTDFNSIINYLLYEWSAKEAEQFITEVYNLIHLLEQGNAEFRKINFKNIHAATISKQITIYHRIQSKYIVAFLRIWDNRQNPKRIGL